MSSFESYINSFTKDNPNFGKGLQSDTNVDSEDVIKRLNLIDDPIISPSTPKIHSSAITRHATSKEGDISEYTPYFDNARVFMGGGDDLNETRARNQTAGQLWKGAISQAVVGHIVGGTLEHTGYLFDIPAMIRQFRGTEEEWGNNWLSSIGHNVKEGAMERNPIHQTRRAQKGGIGGMADRTWWASHAPSVFTSASLILPTFALVKGISALGKALRIGANWTKQTQHAINTVGASLASRHMYSTTESVDNYNTHYDHAKNILMMEDQDAKDYASKSATTNYRWGYANIVKDLLSWGMLLKYPAMANRALRQKVKVSNFKMTEAEGQKALAKSMVARPFKPVDILYHGVLEGAEEFNIQWQKKEGKRAADMQYGYIPDSPYEGLLQRISEHTTDPHTFDSFFWGMAGGMIFGTLGRFASIETFKSNVHKEQETLKNIQNRTNYIRSELNNLITLAEEGNTVDSELSRSNMITTMVADGASRGSLSIDVEFLRNLSELNDQQLKEHGFEDGSIRDIAKSLSKEVEQAGDLYDKIQNQSHGYGEKDAYINNHIFNNTLKLQHLNTLLEKETQNRDNLINQKRSIGKRKLTELGMQKQALEYSLKKDTNILKNHEKQLKKYKALKETFGRFIKDSGIKELLHLHETLKDIDTKISETEGLVEQYKDMIEVDNNLLSEHNKGEQEALKEGLVTKRRLDSDRFIIDSTKDLEINDAETNIENIQSEVESFENNLNKFNSKKEKDAFVESITKLEEKNRKLKEDEAKRKIREAENKEEVEEINREYDKVFDKEAKARISEIEKFEAEEKAREESRKADDEGRETADANQDPTTSTSTSTTTTTGTETVTPDTKSDPAPDTSLVEQQRAAAFKMLDQKAEQYENAGILSAKFLTNDLKTLYDSDPSERESLIEKAEKSLEEFYSDLKLERSEEQLKSSPLINTARLIIDHAIESYNKAKESQQPTSNTTAINKVSNEIVNDLNEANNIIEEDTKRHTDLTPDALSKLNDIAVSFADKVERYLNLLLNDNFEGPINYSTLLKILNERNDNSIETHYLTLHDLMSHMQIIARSNNAIAEKFNFSDLPPGNTIRGRNGLGYVRNILKRQAIENINIIEHGDQANSQGVYVYVDKLGKIEPTGVRTILNKDQENVITALQNIPVNATVKIITNPEHKDSRYKTKKDRAERNEDNTKIPVEIVAEREDGSREHIGFIQELHTPHLGVSYVNDKGEFSHFSKFINFNDEQGNRVVKVLQDNIQVLREIFRGNDKVTIPNQLKEVLDQLASVNQPEIQTASMRSIRHIITPIFYGVNPNFINEYNPSRSQIQSNYKKHYYRFKRDFEHNKNIRNNIVDQKLELNATVVHKGVPEIIRGDTKSNLNTVIKPIDMGDGRGPRVVIARTPTDSRIKQGDTIFDIITGEAVEINNSHVVSKDNAHRGFFTILEPYKGVFQAFPIYTTSLNGNISSDYSAKLNNYVTNKLLELLDAHSNENTEVVESIRSELGKVVMFDGTANLKLNRYDDGITSINFSTLENGRFKYYDLRYAVKYKRDESGNKIVDSVNRKQLELRSTRNLNENNNLINLGPIENINIKDPTLLSKTVGNMLRRVNMDSKTRKLHEDKRFANPEDGFVDPVTGTKHKSYYDYVVNTNAITTTLQALVNESGEIVSNYNPAGRIKGTLFINPTERKVEPKKEDGVNPNDITDLDSYINMLPEMKGYGILLDMAKSLGINFNLTVSKVENLDSEGRKTNASINRLNEITVYPNLFKKSTLEQSTSLAHEILHSIINHVESNMSNVDRGIYDNRVMSYISKLEEADISNLNETEKHILKQFIEITKSDTSELLTYSFADPNVPKILSKIQLETTQRETKTFWTELRDVILSLLNIESSTALQELTNILNEVFDVNDITVNQNMNTEQQRIAEITNIAKPYEGRVPKGYSLEAINIYDEVVLLPAKPVIINELIKKGINAETIIVKKGKKYSIHDKFSGMRYESDHNTIKEAIQAVNKQISSLTRRELIEGLDETNTPLSEINSKYTSRYELTTGREGESDTVTRNIKNEDKVEPEDTKVKKVERKIKGNPFSGNNAKFNKGDKKHVQLTREEKIYNFKEDYIDADGKPLC